MRVGRWADQSVIADTIFPGAMDAARLSGYPERLPSPDFPMPAWSAGLLLAFRHRFLIRAMTRREIAIRYRGSMLGGLWPYLSPLFLLAVYTLVFGTVFKSRWPGTASLGDFAMVLYAGLLLNGLLAETLGRAPLLVLENPNYVKKVVFPLEILPWVSVGSGLFHAAIGFGLLCLANAAAGTGPHASLLALPVLLLPFALLLVGLSWLLAGVGVYLRDLAQLMPPLLTALMFFSPVFYSRAQAPAALQPWLGLNPLTFVIENARRVIFEGAWPLWLGWLNYFAVSLIIYLVGFVVFGRLKKGFADVV